jgi:hypothetical protein
VTVGQEPEVAEVASDLPVLFFRFANGYLFRSFRWGDGLVRLTMIAMDPHEMRGLTFLSAHDAAGSLGKGTIQPFCSRTRRQASR